MTTKIHCDYCRQPIDDDRIILRVEDHDWLNVEAFKAKTLPKRLDFALDLHRSCYMVHFRGPIERLRKEGS